MHNSNPKHVMGVAENEERKYLFTISSHVRKLKCGFMLAWHHSQLYNSITPVLEKSLSERKWNWNHYPLSLYMKPRLSWIHQKREMAFTNSRSQSAFAEKEKENLDILGEKDLISRQLQLKSSKAGFQSLLGRLRQRRSYNRAKRALEALMGTSEANSATVHEQKWLHLPDSFSSP